MLSLLYGPILTSKHDYWKNHTYVWTLVSKVMFLLFNTLSEAPICGHLMWTAKSLEKTLMLGKTEAEGEEGDRGWDGWMASPIQWTETWANLGRWEGQRNLACYSPWGHKELAALGNWTTTTTRFVRAFLPRITCLLVSELQSPSAVILEPKKINYHCFHFSPHLFAMKGWECTPWSYFFECWVLSQLFHSSCTLIKEAL